MTIVKFLGVKHENDYFSNNKKTEKNVNRATRADFFNASRVHTRFDSFATMVNVRLTRCSSFVHVYVEF